MKNSFVPGTAFVTLLLAAPAAGYEVRTHEKMSEHGLLRSVLTGQKNEVLANLGLSFAIDDYRQHFLNSGLRGLVWVIFGEFWQWRQEGGDDFQL